MSILRTERASRNEIDRDIYGLWLYKRRDIFHPSSFMPNSSFFILHNHGFKNPFSMVTANQK